jgi:glycosyltransferase domain-containing protein
MMGGNLPAGSAVTCLVPTHNRANFLRRWFRFYRQFPPGFQVLVADSSRPEAAAENRAIVAHEAGLMAARIQHFDLNLIGKILRALERVETPFVNLCADDDLILPEAVRRSAEFLAANPGYVSAQGRSARVNPARRWFGLNRLRGYSLEQDDSLVRCQTLRETWFTNFYAVFRTETLRDMFRLTEAATDCTETYALAEAFLSQLSAIWGRIKVLPVMHLVMEVHPATASVRHRGSSWSAVESGYQRFHAGLVAEFVRAGIDGTVAGNYLSQQFVHFRDPTLLGRSRGRTGAAWLNYWVRSARERWQDWSHPVNVRHTRSINAADLAGSEPEWRSAVELMRRYPHGMPAGNSDCPGGVRPADDVTPRSVTESGATKAPPSGPSCKLDPP